MTMSDSSNAIILYDGVCGLCNRAVQFLLKRDRHDVFRFAPLQSELAATVLQRHGIDASKLDTVYAILNHGQSDEKLLAKSDAALFFAKALGGVWNIFRLAAVIPRPLRNALYDFIARHRYRVFGQSESCMLPDPQQRHKFLEV